MTLLKDKPVHVRKRIALVCTGIAGLLLIVGMVIVYSHNSDKPSPNALTQLSHFYTTLVQSGQSAFGHK